MCLTSTPKPLSFAVHLEFTAEDLITAARWAELRGFKYRSPEEMLFECMTIGEIVPKNGFQRVEWICKSE